MINSFFHLFSLVSYWLGWVYEAIKVEEANLLVSASRRPLARPHVFLVQFLFVMLVWSGESGFAYLGFVPFWLCFRTSRLVFV